MKPITQRNTNFSIEDFRELERRVGGPVQAAKCMGVAYETWYRYREGRLALTASKARLLELLLSNTRMPLS